MDPDSNIIKNLQWLVDSCLQPLRERLGKPIRITSGYRPPRLNTMIGGSKTSAHRFGRAADIVVPGMAPYYVMSEFIDLALEYDQVIHEFGKWVHIGIAKRPRHQKLTAYYDRYGKIQYVHGLHEIDSLPEVWG